MGSKHLSFYKISLDILQIKLKKQEDGGHL